MLNEDVNKKLIQKDVVSVYKDESIEQFLQLAFTCYFQTNFQKKEIVGRVFIVSSSHGRS